MNKKILILIAFFVALIIAGAGIVIYFLHLKSVQNVPLSDNNGVEVFALPTIPTPQGWQIVQQSTSSIIFSRPFSGNIDVRAAEVDEPMTVYIKNSGEYPFSSPNTGMWAAINGNIILEDFEPSGDGKGETLYSVFHNNVVYTFGTDVFIASTTPEANKTTGQATINTLRAMATNFAGSLPVTIP